MASSSKKWIEPSALSLGVLAMVALFAMVNYLGWKYYKRFDWTSSELYTLSEKSTTVVRGLDRPIEAVVFMSPTEPLFDPVQEMLSRYEAASPSFTARTIDPAKNLLEAQRLVDQYELAQINVVVFDSGDDRRVIEAADLADYDYSGLQYGQGPEMTGFKGEQVFTGAILELVEETKSKIAFTVGHGELRLDELAPRGLGELERLLRQDNFELEEWSSLGQSSIPEDVTLVVIAGPTANFIEPEISMLERFLDRGGRLLVLLDPVLSEDGRIQPSGLERMLESYGVVVGSDIVVDPSNPVPFYGAETIFVDAYGQHPVTRSLSQARIPVIVPLARSVRAGEKAEGIEAIELMMTTVDGWGETDLANLSRVEAGGDDLAGPVSLAVAVAESGADEPDPESEVAEKDGVESQARSVVADPKMRLAVIGDADLTTNAQLLNVGNAELMLNIFNWLAEREALLGIPPKAPEQVRLSLSRSELRTVAGLVFGVLPGLAVLLGVTVFFRRRR